MLPLFLLPKTLFSRSKTLLRLVCDPSEIAKRVQSANTYKRVNNSGKQRHIAEENSNQIKAKEANQPPVNGADNDKYKHGII